MTDYRLIKIDQLVEQKKINEAQIELSKLGREFLKTFCGNKKGDYAEFQKRFDVEKGLFPHNLATSIKRLKNTKHLPSKDSPLWISVLTGKAPDGDKIDKARKHFVKSKSKNLYQYVEALSHLLLPKDLEIFHILMLVLILIL